MTALERPTRVGLRGVPSDRPATTGPATAGAAPSSTDTATTRLRVDAPCLSWNLDFIAGPPIHGSAPVLPDLNRLWRVRSNRIARNRSGTWHGGKRAPPQEKPLLF